MSCFSFVMFISTAEAGRIRLLCLQGACMPCLLNALFISAIHASEVFVVDFCKGHACLVF